MRAQSQIENRLKELNQKIDYLSEFISVIYKGSDLKEKTERELISFKQQAKELHWVLNGDDLPF